MPEVVARKIARTQPFEEPLVGKGDKRTFRGKVFKGSHGKTRPRKPKKKASKPA
jgi:30S ribosomal protein S31